MSPPSRSPCRSSFLDRSEPPPPFSCTTQDGCVAVAGEIDLATTPQLERALRHALRGAAEVVLDLREVTFLDSWGATAIVVASARASLDGRRLVLLHGPRNVDRLFALTGTTDHVVFVQPPAERAVA